MQNKNADVAKEIPEILSQIVANGASRQILKSPQQEKP
jgi:hypothetical protein